MPVLTSLYCPSCNNPISPGTKFCASCGHHLEVANETDGDPLIGKFVGGRYLVQAKLGEGGMGAVYQAEQVAMKRPVALKVLHPHLAQDEQLIQRFRREAGAAAKLTHPNTITVHDFDQTEDGTLYISMEFVEGRNLADEIDNSGAMQWPRAVGIVLQIAESLADAHAAGIVHRDLKPDNVMLMERAKQSDFVKILDFGIAKMAESAEDGDKRKALTKTGMIFGTPQYMSPEQIRGAGVDHRTDIYALGVILYQLVTGDLPFLSENPMGMLTKHLMEPPRPISHAMPGANFPPPLEALVMRCLAKEQDQRFQSMNEIIDVLKSFAHETRPGFAVQTPAPLPNAPNALTTGQAQPGFGGQNLATPPPGGDVFTRPPTDGFTNPPSGGFAGDPSGGFNSQTSGGFAGQTSGFAGQASGPVGAPAPSSSSTVRTIVISLVIIGVLGALGVGGAFAWKMLSDDDSPDPNTTAQNINTTTAQNTTNTTTQNLTTTQNTATQGTTTQGTTTQGTSHGTTQGTTTQGTSTTTQGTTTAPPSKSAQCTVEPSGKSAATKALATSLASRQQQLSLCFAPLLNKNFDGSVRLSYRFGRGKGPTKFRTTKNTLNNEQVIVCLKTAVQMAKHPDSKTTKNARIFVKAAGAKGVLKACKIAASIPQRSKGKGPKPTWWNPNQPYYPPYGGYGR